MARQVHFKDELTICTVGSMANELLNALQGGQDVMVDLSGVERIDTAALQVLVAAKNEAGIQGISFSCTASDVVRDYAAYTGIVL